MATLMLLACLGIMGTALPSVDSAAPTEIDELVNFIPEGWTTNDLLRALSNDGRNVSTIQQSYCSRFGSFGGNGGAPFDDYCNRRTKITRIEIRVGPVGGCGNCLRYIRTCYRDGRIAAHGIAGHNTQGYTINLKRKRLIGVAVRSGTLIDQITFLAASKKGKRFYVYGPYGGSGGTTDIKFGEIQGFYGRSGHGIDQIGFKGKLFA